MHSAAFPEEGKICFINGKVWVDLSMEEYYSHNRVRTEICATHALTDEEDEVRAVRDWKECGTATETQETLYHRTRRYDRFA